MTPYLHNGSELKLDVVHGKGVICNLFTNDPSTKHRISWKNIELTTVIRNNKTLYCLKTNGYNHVAKHDDRRLHERLIVQIAAKVLDDQSEEGVNVIIHDISDIGISFYAPKTYIFKNNQLNILFSDTINDKTFEVNVKCAIARTTSKVGNQFVGCRITKENKDYQLYCFMKRLNSNTKNKTPKQEEKQEEKQEN